MWPLLVYYLSLLPLAAAQNVGDMVPEVHPRLQWTKCEASGDCRLVNGEVVLDANYRWIHKIDSYENCYSGNDWDYRVCNSEKNCTERCAIEGASYETGSGIKVVNDTISQRYKVYLDFASNVGSRLHLMASKDQYQMFTLLDNEFAFDIDLSTVGCGINAALHFVAMDEDGGKSKHVGNKAGAEYGTGYCDSNCPQNMRYVGGKTNSEGWRPSATDPGAGEGPYGACCPEFALWNSNSHSFSFSSHTCPRDEFEICQVESCGHNMRYRQRPGPRCDMEGCSYNPYRMGATEFYGKGKTVDTSKKFTVVTRFDQHQVSQFFVQNGKRIDLASPTLEGLPKTAGLSEEMCSRAPILFEEDNIFQHNEGWKTHLKLMQKPMVLTLSILDDHWGYNLWLDGLWVPEDEGTGRPGIYRGDCSPWEDNEPAVVQARNPQA